MPGLLKSACQAERQDGVGLAVSVLRMEVACSHMFVSFFKDVNLKMPKSNQPLHFAFREDKQWKLQQVLFTLDA